MDTQQYFHGRPILDVGYGRCGNCFKYVTTLLLGGAGYTKEWKRMEMFSGRYCDHTCVEETPPTDKAAA